MNIKEICEQIITFYNQKQIDTKEDYFVLRYVGNLREQVDKIGLSPRNLQHILEVTSRIALSSTRPRKQLLEKELLRYIAFLPYKLWNKKNRELQNEHSDIDHKLADLLIQFAKEMYLVKNQRDAFSGSRRGYTIQILQYITLYFKEIPDFLELAKKSLKSKGKSEFLEAIEALELYCEERGESIDDEMIEILDKRILKTKHRTEAVAALNLQIKAGLIDELDALDRIDEWKEKNYNY